MIRGRLRRRGRGHPDAPAADDYVEIDTAELSGIFRAPDWLRDAGIMSWLLVGIALLATSLVALLGLTQVIVLPVITAAIVAAVASPVVAWLQRHHVPRAMGAALMLLSIVAIGAGLVLMIVGGITSETSAIQGHLADAKDEIGGWVQDAGVDPKQADDAKESASKGLSDSFSTLLDGVLKGVAKLSSLAFFVAMVALSLFFLLKDGPQIRAWAEKHLGVPEPVAQTVTRRVLGSLRGYFLGVTVVAGFNAVVVTIGALILGVPLVGTIAAVTFIGAYIPYLGAWSAAGFSVLIALGGAGPEEAGGMIVVQLLANGILQQLVQPFAMGAALGIHPLAVLIVTIAGGALFGAIGLVLAAPIVSAITRISADLARARAEEEEKGEQRQEAGTDPPGAEPAPV
jgi:predicted PurR-regulated permease PerM